ncbi:MAG: hypothetical protein EZS28_009392 [Streblomastix strix]|uniref:Uncharacterized protein n=1 Tax=Streblomastix strix TaxID=222440 RepID=A0A5J4WJN1_9EUKA|nr:MAG: hypothetical protein EZS28_009392 [Streblomastix strix]
MHSTATARADMLEIVANRLQDISTLSNYRSIITSDMDKIENEENSGQNNDSLKRISKKLDQVEQLLNDLTNANGQISQEIRELEHLMEQMSGDLHRRFEAFLQQEQQNDRLRLVINHHPNSQGNKEIEKLEERLRNRKLLFEEKSRHMEKLRREREQLFEMEEILSAPSLHRPYSAPRLSSTSSHISSKHDEFFPQATPYPQQALGLEEIVRNTVEREITRRLSEIAVHGHKTPDSLRGLTNSPVFNHTPSGSVSMSSVETPYGKKEPFIELRQLQIVKPEDYNPLSLSPSLSFINQYSSIQFQSHFLLHQFQL